MNTILLIFFVLPIAVIVVSIALQRLLRCPLLVASIIFVIFLIVATVLSDVNVFVIAVAYALLAYISAILSCIICRIIANNPDLISCNNCCRSNNDDNSGCPRNNVATQNSTVPIDDITIVTGMDQLASSNCGCSNNNSTAFVAEASVVPNCSTNGRTGNFRGCYRRR